MEYLQDNWIIGLVLLIVVLLIGYLITGWYHRIYKRIRLQEAQLYVLIKIAAGEPIKPEVLKQLANYANIDSTMLIEAASNKQKD